jgi:hypothetical protein
MELYMDFYLDFVPIFAMLYRKPKVGVGTGLGLCAFRRSKNFSQNNWQKLGLLRAQVWLQQADRGHTGGSEGRLRHL